MSLWSSGMSHDWTGLLVPPLMFQTRLSTTACNKAVAYPFLASQYDLVNSSHCPRDGMCDGIVGPDDMMQVSLVHLMNQCMQLQHGSEECQGQRGPWLNHMSQPHLCSKLTRSTHCQKIQCTGTEESTEPFFAITPQTLKGETGFADFLFTFSDNPIVVRDGKTLPTRNFFDANTFNGKAIACFVVPGQCFKYHNLNSCSSMLCVRACVCDMSESEKHLQTMGC